MMFQEVDKNHDGHLSFEEFKEAAQMQPFIMKCFKLETPSNPLRASSPPKKIDSNNASEGSDATLSNPEEWVVM